MPVHLIPRRGLDLDLTLYPSFLLALLERHGDRYVKVAGYNAGCYMEVRGDFIATNCDSRAAEFWTGTWFLETMERSKCARSIAWLVEALREQYPGLSLAVNPYDPLHMFVVIALSQNTDFHRNVVKWCRALWRISPDPLEASTKAWTVGRSYQLTRLVSLTECAARATRGPPRDVRRRLLSCKGIGPKTADAFLLFAMAVPETAPIDKHFTRMCSRLGLWGGASPPSKPLCVRYDCESCPRNNKCFRYLAFKGLGSLAGWVQTAFYVHDREFCRRRKCGECLLRPHCSAPTARVY